MLVDGNVGKGGDGEGGEMVGGLGDAGLGGFGDLDIDTRGGFEETTSVGIPGAKGDESGGDEGF